MITLHIYNTALMLALTVRESLTNGCCTWKFEIHVIQRKSGGTCCVSMEMNHVHSSLPYDSYFRFTWGG